MVNFDNKPFRMRLISSVLLFVGLYLTPGVALAGNTVVLRHYNVAGVCGKCKARIESAAYVKGVRFAEWSVESHDLAIKYDTVKTSPAVFLKSIAKAGHDNEMFKAEDNDYNKLPACCKYRSGIKAH